MFITRTQSFVCTIIVVIAVMANTAWGDMVLQYTWQERAVKDGQIYYVDGRQYRDTVNGIEKTEYYDFRGQLILNPSDWGLKYKSWQNNNGHWSAGAVAAATSRDKSTPFAVPSLLQTRLSSPPDAVLTGMSADAIANFQAIQQSEPGRPPLIGVRRLLSPTLTNSSDQSAANGWQADPHGNNYLLQRISVADSKGIRINIENIQLPPGAYFFVYATQKPGEFRGPYDASFLQGRDTFWTESLYSGDVTLAAFVPVTSDRTSLSFTVREIADIFTIPSHNPLRVGSCNKDVTCYPEWQSQADAVTGIGTVNSIGVLWCSGTLLNDSSTPKGNYFMTAYHCVGNQAEADTTEYYWFYQTSTCNGTPPLPSNVPRSGGGAIFLAGMKSDVGNDFSFLKLRQAVPANVTYAGWTSAPLAKGDKITGIHHPDGSFKRYSSGVLDKAEPNWWYVQWQLGVTEGGSSGSPLFNANRLFTGQLRGGASSCDFPEGIDDYGRFDVTYPIVAQWLSNTSYPLALSFSGTGGGAVSGEISCVTGASCPAVSFMANTAISLMPVPDSNSLFKGWSGACTNTSGICAFVMDGPRDVTAAFAEADKIRIGTRPYLSLASALPDAATGQIMARGIEFTESVSVALPTDLKGGFNADFGDNAGRYTFLKGTLRIVSPGRLQVEALKIKPGL